MDENTLPGCKSGLEVAVSIAFQVMLHNLGQSCTINICRVCMHPCVVVLKGGSVQSTPNQSAAENVSSSNELCELNNNQST